MEPVIESEALDFLFDNNLQWQNPDIEIRKWSHNGVVLAECFNGQWRIDKRAAQLRLNGVPFGTRAA